MNKKERIVALLRKELESALYEYRMAIAKRAATIAGANAWDENNPDDGVGGFSQNPYNLNHVDGNEMDTKVYYEQIKEAYEFAIDTFLKD